jgi:heme exporter protein D
MTFNHGQAANMSRPFSTRGEHVHFEAGARDSGATKHHQSTKPLTMRKYPAPSSIGTSHTKEFRLHELAMLSIAPILRSIHHWWLQREEQHYLICADVEQQRAREAQMNVAYYQKRAALARSARY